MNKLSLFILNGRIEPCTHTLNEKCSLRLPSLEEQQKLSKAFADLDMELISLKVEKQTVPKQKQAILDKYLKWLCITLHELQIDFISRI